MSQNEFNIKNQKRKYINILLLGEGGAGKSTFINSFANYIIYKFIDKAESSKLITPISCEFEIRDENYEDHTIRVDSELNEKGANGIAGVKTYVFPVWNYWYRLIDTQGLGGTNTIEQDETNCENIFKYVNTLDGLHAICLIFKSTSLGLSGYSSFSYCLSQFFCCLEKSASANVFFVFTYAKSLNTRYASSSLNQFLLSIKHSFPTFDIVLKEKENFLRFENNVFNYLAAALEFKIPIGSTQKENYKKNWIFSASTSHWFINRLKEIEPYIPSKLHVIQEMRKNINKLLPILVYLSQKWTKINNLLQQYVKKRELCSADLEKLKDRRHITVPSAESINCEHSLMVCTSLPCATVYKVQDENKWHYGNICKFLGTEFTSIQRDIIGEPGLIHFENFNKHSQNCKHCGCKFSVHMLIDYVTITKKELVNNHEVIKQIKEKELTLQALLAVINHTTRKIYKVEKERDIVGSVCKKIIAFLHMHAMLPINNDYRNYIVHLINEKRFTSETEHLPRLSKNFEEYHKLFEDITNYEDLYVSKEDIDEEIKELFDLERRGQHIRQLFEKESDTEIFVPEYVHRVDFNKTDLRKSGDSNGKKNQKFGQQHTKKDATMKERNENLTNSNTNEKNEEELAEHKNKEENMNSKKKVPKSKRNENDNVNEKEQNDNNECNKQNSAKMEESENVEKSPEEKKKSKAKKNRRSKKNKDDQKSTSSDFPEDAGSTSGDTFYQHGYQHNSHREDYGHHHGGSTSGDPFYQHGYQHNSHREDYGHHHAGSSSGDPFYQHGYQHNSHREDYGHPHAGSSSGDPFYRGRFGPRYAGSSGDGFHQPGYQHNSNHGDYRHHYAGSSSRDTFHQRGYQHNSNRGHYGQHYAAGSPGDGFHQPGYQNNSHRERYGPPHAGSSSGDPFHQRGYQHNSNRGHYGQYSSHENVNYRQAHPNSGNFASPDSFYRPEYQQSQEKDDEQIEVKVLLRKKPKASPSADQLRANVSHSSNPPNYGRFPQPSPSPRPQESPKFPNNYGSQSQPPIFIDAQGLNDYGRMFLSHVTSAHNNNQQMPPSYEECCQAAPPDANKNSKKGKHQIYKNNNY